MIKKTYMEPEMNVVKIQQQNIICASLTSVKTEGLDPEDVLTLPDGETTGSIWDIAM